MPGAKVLRCVSSVSKDDQQASFTRYRQGVRYNLMTLAWHLSWRIATCDTLREIEGDPLVSPPLVYGRKWLC